MKIIKAPEHVEEGGTFLTVFLAGSIEMGTVEDWQAKVENELSDYDDEVLRVLNPRRDDFDTSTEQSIDNPYFKEQVMWELAGLECANFILMYFHPDTKAPITLLELGLYADRQAIIVVCPDGFWRKGNVEVICDVYDIPLYTSLEEGIAKIREDIDYEKDFLIKKLFYDNE